jgi:primosomal protein N' (replication factor Y)
LTGSKKVFVEVAVALPVFKTLTYEVPDRFVSAAQIGKRVLVPVRNSQATGYILDLPGETEQEGVKQVLDVLDEHPLFPPSMSPFFRWIADYYIHPIGEVIRGALPSGLNATRVRVVGITDCGRAVLSRQGSLAAFQTDILRALEQRGPVAVRTLASVLQREVSCHVINQLEGKGLVCTERRIQKGRVCPKKEKYVDRAPNSVRPVDGLSRKSREILSMLEGRGEIALQALKKQFPSAGPLVTKMAAAGLLRIEEKEVYRDPFGEPIHGDSPPVLTADQASVVDEIVQSVGQGFRTCLLHGITGSGKTEVYMRAVAAALDKGCHAVVLVPEIALISQTERLFRARFGDCVALLHSGLSQGERFDQWMRIVRAEAKIAIGARSAIFAPFERLGLIIVDEEHDDSYKQETRVRYHARDLAVVRAKLDNAVALLGSATPSVQSYFNVQTRRYHGLRLDKRIENQALPEVRIVDLRSDKEGRRSKPLFTAELKQAIEETLDRKEQVLLFLNRRGFASSPTCTSCGAPVRCKNCDVTMTYHQGANAFRCHYCGHSFPKTTGCRVCGNPRVKPLGLGTEQVEAQVKAAFPEATVARMDRDTTRHKGALLRMLKDLRRGKTDILVGTQMVAQGHHYPNITLVGILCADLSLNFPDFRAGERTFQLLAQVAGRAGRGTCPGRVILQTYNPDHFCITTAADQAYAAFYRHETAFRKSVMYPPYARLVQILLTGKDEAQTARFAHELGRLCQSLQKENPALAKDVRVLGPVAAPLSRIKKQYRWHLLLKGKSADSLHALARSLKAAAEQAVRPADTKLIINVDPVDML